MNHNIINQICKTKYVLNTHLDFENSNDLDMYDDYNFDESTDESIEEPNPLHILLKKNDTMFLLDNKTDLPLDNKNILDSEFASDLDKVSESEFVFDLDKVSESVSEDDFTEDIDYIIDTIYNYNESFKNNPYYKEYLLQNFDCILNNPNSIKEVYTAPTQLRISTMTAICCINLCVDLELLYNTFNNLDNNVEQFPYIKSCKLGNHKIKGDSIKKKKKKKF